MKPTIFISTLLLSCVIAGCATTQSSSYTSDCSTADWKQIGITDGTHGHNAQRILSHQKACQKTNTTPNIALWEEGRQIGLKNYCTKANAYDLGRHGYTLTGVCEDNLDELHHANMMGLEQYELSRRMMRPYGYGYHPFYAPWAFYWSITQMM